MLISPALKKNFLLDILRLQFWEHEIPKYEFEWELFQWDHAHYSVHRINKILKSWFSERSDSRATFLLKYSVTRTCVHMASDRLSCRYFLLLSSVVGFLSMLAAQLPLWHELKYLYCRPSWHPDNKALCDMLVGWKIGADFYKRISCITCMPSQVLLWTLDGWVQAGGTS